MNETARPETGHSGVVKRIEGKNAVVQFARTSMCKHCGACLAIGDKEMELAVENTLHASVGDRVTVELSARRVVQASLLAYLVPLIALLAGVWAGSQFSDLWAMIAGAAACGASFLLLRLLEKKRRLREAFAPRMTSLTIADTEGGEDGR